MCGEELTAVDAKGAESTCFKLRSPFGNWKKSLSIETTSGIKYSPSALFVTSAFNFFRAATTWPLLLQDGQAECGSSSPIDLRLSMHEGPCGTGILCIFSFRGSLLHGPAGHATFVGPALPYALSTSNTWGPSNHNDNY